MESFGAHQDQIFRRIGTFLGRTWIVKECVIVLDHVLCRTIVGQRWSTLLLLRCFVTSQISQLSSFVCAECEWITLEQVNLSLLGCLSLVLFLLSRENVIFLELIE